MIVTPQIIAAAASTLGFASSLCGDQQFDVSLWSARSVDLSPYYQQVVREATKAYRGDFPTRTILFSHLGYIDTPLLRVPAELEDEFDPFPPSPFTLRSTVRGKDSERIP